jgi:AraC-like DNA-binding protein
VGGLFKKLFSVWVGRGEGYYFECLSLLYKIFAEINRQDYIPEKQYQAMKPAIEYITEHFLDKKLSVDTLAARCGISSSYLKKLFIRKFAMPPSQYIINLKLNYACDLLRSERYSISQVAEICGYTDIYFFSRQFKAHIGISPSVFLKNYKSSK